MDLYKKDRLYSVLSLLPARVGREIDAVVRAGSRAVSEIRLSGYGISTLTLGGRAFPLYARLTTGELGEILRGFCHDSLYAYRDAINGGSVSLDGGVRVGIIGEARVEDGRMIGVDSISALAIRIPTGRCDFADGLYRGWESRGGGNMLICAPPCHGKTTALRALAALIGSGAGARRVVVVDERGEFDGADYSHGRVDILRGYGRARGVEMAVRLFSPGVLLVDEIATPDDAAALRLAVGVGVPVIATAHGAGLSDLMRRDFLRGLLTDGCFSLYTRLYRMLDRFEADEPREIAI